LFEVVQAMHKGGDQEADVMTVGQANVAPHRRRAGGDARGVPEAGAAEPRLFGGVSRIAATGLPAAPPMATM
jgi:hypothetical protein